MRLTLAMVMGTLSGCYAGLGLPDGDGDGGEGAAAETTTSGGGSEGSGGEAVGEVDPPTLRRLTRVEFSNSVKDLLGPVTLGPVEVDTEAEGFFSVGAAQVALSPAGVGVYELALDVATSEAFADPAAATALVACMPASRADSDCIRESIAAFGRRAWRRPLTAAEVDRYLAIAADVGEQTGDEVAALRHAIWGLLQSPNFLYRVELGTTSEEDGGRLKFSAWEMASRLSFTLWATTPDDTLLDAAQSDDLSTSEGIRAQATRLLADPRARQGVRNFVAELYGFWRLGEKDKDPALYPGWTPTLKEVMRADLLARVEDVVFDEPRDVFELYDSKRVFVNNELARSYGLPEVEPDVLRPDTLPESDARRGLIGSALILSLNSLPQRTSATQRGLFIIDKLLCMSVPPPPPNVDTALDDDDGVPGGPPVHRTLREKLEPHRENQECAVCHNLTDPIGLALEHFDTMGRYRETDLGLAIDASGELDGVPFADADELAGILRDHPRAASCLVDKLQTYVAGRRTFSEEREMADQLMQALEAADNRFDELLYALVTHDDFRFANPRNTALRADEDGP